MTYRLLGIAMVLAACSSGDKMSAVTNDTQGGTDGESDTDTDDTEDSFQPMEPPPMRVLYSRFQINF